MGDYAVEMFKHHLWANLCLLDACERAGDEALDAKGAGVYGTIRATIVHILAAEERYVSLLTGRVPEHPLREADAFPGFDELRQRARGSGETLIEVAKTIPAGRFYQGSDRGSGYAMPAHVPVVQAIHHASEHRAQIAMLLSRNGVTPPDLSAWAWGTEAGYAT